MSSKKNNKKDKIVETIKEKPSLISRIKSIKKEQIILALIVFAIFVIPLFSIKVFRDKYSSKPKQDALVDKNGSSDVFDKNDSVKDIDILITDKKVDPSSVKVNVSQEYNFRVIKLPGAVCSKLKNVELDYEIELPNTADQFVARFPSKGEYTFECVDGKEKIRVVVE